MELASLIISIVALIAMGVVIFLLCKKNTSASTLKGEDIQDMCDNVQEYIQKDIEDTKNELRSARAELKSAVEATSTAYNAAMGPYMEGFNRRLEKLTEDNTRELAAIKDVILVLADAQDPKDYLSKMRRREPELAKGWGLRF